MHWTLLSLWTCCCLTASASTPPTKDLPPDWPPLPDFKQHVEYVKWLQERLSVPPEDDARPLWNEITEQESDSEQVKRAKNQMWAYDDKHGIPGLFTGDDEAPDCYAWDPNNHPEWEAAYQVHSAMGLTARLAAIAQRKRMSQPFWFFDLRELQMSQPAGSSKPAQAPVDPGLTKDDRLILNLMLPSLAALRSAVMVLLQDAWRAPHGKPSADAMQEALRTSLGIATQCDHTTLIGYLVSIAIRSKVYDSALRAIRDDVFDPTQLAAANGILTSLDNQDLTSLRPDAVELADVLEVLQFIYRPQPDGRPKADMERVQRLGRYRHALHQFESGLSKEPLDLSGLIDHCDPQAGVRQTIDLYLKIREILRNELPHVAADRIQHLVAEFKHNPQNHLLAREFVWDASRSVLMGAQCEAQRRATHLLYALHIQHNRTGEWPATIGGIVGVSRTIRTDPFSGKDFCYRIQDGRPLLYSVAMNGKDDGGKHDEQWGRRFADSRPATPDADYVFWPIQPRRR